MTQLLIAYKVYKGALPRFPRMKYPMGAAHEAVGAMRRNARARRRLNAMRMRIEGPFDRDKLSKLIRIKVPQAPEMHTLSLNELQLAKLRDEAADWQEADAYRGFLGEAIVAASLEYQGFAAEYGKYAESTGQRDFKLQAENGQEITLEVKTCPEHMKRSDPSRGYSGALIEGGKMASAYCIAVKLCEPPEQGSLVAIFGYLTHKQVKELKMQRGYLCPRTPCKAMDLEGPLTEIANLWKELKDTHHVKTVDIADIWEGIRNP